MSIALLDYGAGNLASVRKGLAAAGADVCVPASPADVARAEAVVIPGVGHFAATRALDDGWRSAILEVIRTGRPLLGICLGMQWLFEGSAEAPDVAGLGLFAGSCFRLPAGDGLKVPHVGWNRLQVASSGRLLDGLEDGAYAYFTHSYAAPLTEAAGATATHGPAFAAAVERDAVFGVQFHPEKSGDAGLRILRNFVAVARAR